MSQETETFEIILGRLEHINASPFNCLSFAMASNMASGYPFSFDGATWHDSETLNLCGEFSDASDKHLSVQRKCGSRQVALLPNALSRTNTRDSFVVISLHSAYSG